MRLPEACKSSDVAGVREEGNGEKSAQALRALLAHVNISAEMPTGNMDNIVHQTASPEPAKCSGDDAIKDKALVTDRDSLGQRPHAARRQKEV